jgi:hypothetical protein
MLRKKRSKDLWARASHLIIDILEPVIYSRNQRWIEFQRGGKAGDKMQSSSLRLLSGQALEKAPELVEKRCTKNPMTEPWALIANHIFFFFFCIFLWGFFGFKLLMAALLYRGAQRRIPTGSQADIRTRDLFGGRQPVSYATTPNLHLAPSFLKL